MGIQHKSKSLRTRSKRRRKARKHAARSVKKAVKWAATRAGAPRK